MLYRHLVNSLLAIDLLVFDLEYRELFDHNLTQLHVNCGAVQHEI